MKKLVLLLLCGLMMSSLCIAQPVETAGNPAAASEKKAPAKKAKKKKAAAKSLSGTVVSIDAEAKTIVLTVKKKKVESQETVSLDENTKIKKAKNDIALADIVAGDKVNVRYTVKDGAKVAKSVTVRVKAASKKAKKK